STPSTTRMTSSRWSRTLGRSRGRSGSRRSSWTARTSASSTTSRCSRPAKAPSPSPSGSTWREGRSARSAASEADSRGYPVAEKGLTPHPVGRDARQHPPARRGGHGCHRTTGDIQGGDRPRLPGGQGHAVPGGGRSHDGLRIRIDFHDIDGKDVCRVSVKPAPRPVYAPSGTGEEHLFIRAGNSTRQLSPRETVEYRKMRWG